MRRSRRSTNTALMNHMKSLPCLICGRNWQVNGHHIITRARLGPDIEWNLLPLCFIHHREIHDTAHSEMIKKYPQLEMEYEKRGFEFFNGKLIKKGDEDV